MLKRSGKTGRFCLLITLWFLINFLQAIFSEINPDEAYYFLYGRHLSWGYFDHPPMVALLVHISSWFFNGNLGVRFMTVLFQIATLLLIWLQIERRYTSSRQFVLLFFIVSASLTMFAIYGFTTTPDVPLLFLPHYCCMGINHF